MISNKNISNLSLQKMWDKFNKMNDVILVLMSTNWIQQEDGTFTNTIPYAGFSSEELYEIDLYDDGNLSDTKITEYEEYITEFNINEGELVAVAKTAPTQTISIVVKGQFVAESVTIGNWEQVEGSINQLETKIDELTTPSEWIPIKYSSDFTKYSTAYVHGYRKIGNLVEIRGVAKPLNTLPKTTGNSSYLLFKLPEGYRPPYDLSYIMQGSGVNKWLLNIIASTGTVSCSRYGATEFIDIPSGAWLPFNCIFGV